MAYMSQVLQANIFFFITAVTVVVLGIILAFALVYLIRILRDVKEVSALLKEQAEMLSADMNDLRQKIRRTEWRWADIFTAIASLWTKKKGRK